MYTMYIVHTAGSIGSDGSKHLHPNDKNIKLNHNNKN